MSNATQLHLLADHIKLSLLERQRAQSLNLEPGSQDGHISRSLDQMREGIEAIERDSKEAEEDNEIAKSAELAETAQSIRTLFNDLSAQFQGFAPASSTLTNQPSDPSLSPSFAHAKDPRPRIPPSSSSFKRSPAGTDTTPSKSVRFRDNPPPSSAQQQQVAEDANRAALFPYRDDPNEDGAADATELDNEQIHTYHTNVLREQDEQLDRLGESIGRQRDLSIQIGDELDDHIHMLDDVEGHVDRHQGRLDGARSQLDKVYRRSKENWGCTIISILVLILVILIIALK